MKIVHWFYAGCVTLVVVIYSATNTWPVSNVFNIVWHAFDQDEDWWQSWIGALSGWVAAAGALAAALLTLPHLKRQADEAKRQADFALGDSAPSFDVYAEDFVEVYFRVVNWNRRTLLIDQIKFDGIIAVEVRAVQISNKKEMWPWELGIEPDNDPIFNSAIRVPGFEDRTKPPISCTIKARAFGGYGVGLIDAKFTVLGRLLGENHGTVELKANATIHTFGTISDEADF